MNETSNYNTKPQNIVSYSYKSQLYTVCVCVSAVKTKKNTEMIIKKSV